MRLSPGTRLGLHRHTGEVHALTLTGERRLNNGRVVRPGDYIPEPAGNVDLWVATGFEELLVYAVVKSSVEYLVPHHTVLQRIATADRRVDYRRWCETVGVPPLSLLGACGSQAGRGTSCSVGKHMVRRNMSENRL